jgi:hypothetical protein
LFFTKVVYFEKIGLLEAGQKRVEGGKRARRAIAKTQILFPLVISGGREDI